MHNMFENMAHCRMLFTMMIATEKGGREEIAAEKEKHVDGVVDEEEMEDGEEGEKWGVAEMGREPVIRVGELKRQIVENVAVDDNIVEESAEAVEDGGVEHGGHVRNWFARRCGDLRLRLGMGDDAGEC